jgi:branched-chain amino acid transport system permease protein
MDVFTILTINGLATGLLLFMMAAGLSVIFGLLGIMNFAHGAFFMLGSYASTWIYLKTGNFALAMIGGTAVGTFVGFLTERSIIRPVYGNPLGQILITLGAFLVLNEMVKALWGPNVIPSPVPPLLDGDFRVGGVAVSRYRIFIIVFGLSTAAAVQWLLNRSRLGMIVRAGVENAEMIQVLGVNIRRVFAVVFLLGTALASLGGTMIGPTLGQIGPFVSTQYLLLAFIVVVIGGMGSLIGSLVAGVLVGLMNNYIVWIYPPAAMPLNIILMSLVLLVKPTGLFGKEGAH